VLKVYLINQNTEMKMATNAAIKYYSYGITRK